jgi:O-antigen ligase
MVLNKSARRFPEDRPMTKLVQPAGFALGAFFTLVPAVSVGGALALAVLLCAAGALALRPSQIKQGIEKRPVPLVLLLGFALWVVITTLWSPLPLDDQVWKILIMVPLGALFIAAATADSGSRNLVLAGAIAGAGVLATLLAIEARWDMVLNRAAQPQEDGFELLRHGGRGTTVLLALLWPATGALLLMGGVLRQLAALVLLAMGAWLSLQFGQAANTAAFVVGLLAFGCGYVAPRLTLLAGTGALTAWLLAAPVLAPVLHTMARTTPNIPFSWEHRAAIWDYVSQRIVERPVFGHGLEASRAETQRLIVQQQEAWAIPVHPHNASLQIWFETGAIGALLAAAALLTGGMWLARRYANNRPGAAAASALMASLGAVANISYGLWAEWWVATIFVGAALAGALAVYRVR